MGESRSYVDNASASSEDSTRPLPRLDPSKLKSGPGALPVNAFDPLRHSDVDNFWYQIDSHFHPVNQEHVRNLRSLPVNPYNGLYDREIRLPLLTGVEIKSEGTHRKHDVKRDLKRDFFFDDGGKQPFEYIPPVKVKSESQLVSHRSSSSFNSEVPKSVPTGPDSATMCASLNSFPYTQRLIAALLDENPDGTQTPSVPTKIPHRYAVLNGCLWMGAGSEPELRAYQSTLETRVKLELSEKGWLDGNHEHPLDGELRMEQWKLRDLKTVNRIRKLTVCSKIISTELKQQADLRARKKQQDMVEMAYLERMIAKMKKNKKSRSKYQKLLSRKFGHYTNKDKLNEKAKKGMETVGNVRGALNGVEKLRPSGKKKKKNKGNHDLPTKSISKGPTR